MATRNDKRVILLGYAGLLLGISSATVVAPASAQEPSSGFASAATGAPTEEIGAPTPIEGGQAPSAGPSELSYDEALKALERTKEHSKAAETWGQPRKVDIPKGSDPNAVIQESLIKVPGVLGADKTSVDPGKVTPLKYDGPMGNQAPQAAAPEESPQAPKAQADANQNQEGGWDWVGENKTETPQAPAKPKPTGFTTVFDAKSGIGQQKIVPTSLSQNTDAEAINLDGGAQVPGPGEGVDDSSTAASPASSEDGPPKTAADSAKEAINIYNSAVKMHLSGKLDQAISEYRAALNVNPELSQAHCNLGLIFNQQHDYAKALVEFRKALAIDPKDAITYNGIGAALRAQKDMEGAIKNWKTAVTLDPHLATAHYNLGTVYEIQKDYDKAVEAYNEALKNDYRLGEAYYRLGLIMRLKNRIEDAKENFSKALQVSKNAEYCEDARKKLAAMEQAKTR